MIDQNRATLRGDDRSDGQQLSWRMGRFIIIPLVTDVELYSDNCFLDWVPEKYQEHSSKGWYHAFHISDADGHKLALLSITHNADEDAWHVDECVGFHDEYENVLEDDGGNPTCLYFLAQEVAKQYGRILKLAQTVDFLVVDEPW